MKKLLNFFAASLIVGSSAAQVTACNPFSHKILAKNLAKWNTTKIIFKDANVAQAIAYGKSNVYVNPTPNSTPFVDTDGTYHSINQMAKANFDQGQKIVTTPDATNGMSVMQLDYIPESFFIWYQKKAKNNENAPLETLENFSSNFGVAIYYGQAVDEHAYTYPDKDGKYPIEKLKDIIEQKAKQAGYNGIDKYYDHVKNPSDTVTETTAQKMANFWSKTDTPMSKNGGYAGTIKNDGLQMGSNEQYHVIFDFDLILIPDHYQNINGKNIPVSKDGYYISGTDDNHVYISEHLPLLFEASTF